MRINLTEARVQVGTLIMCIGGATRSLKRGRSREGHLINCVNLAHMQVNLRHFNSIHVYVDRTHFLKSLICPF